MSDMTIQSNSRLHNSPRIFTQFSTKPKSWVINVHNDSDSEKPKNSKKVLLIGLAAAAGVLFMSKGFQKNTQKSLNKLKEYLEGKLDTLNLRETGKLKTIYSYSLRKLNSFIKKTESFNNIISLKDILFMKLMYKTKPTMKIHNYISDVFENISRKTIKNSYKKTGKSFDVMYKKFDELDDYILKNHGDETIEYEGKEVTKREFIERIRGCRDMVKLSVSTFLSDSAQNNRYDYIKKSTSKLYSKFWDESFKGFWSKDNKFKSKKMWHTFIAAEQIKGDKSQLAEGVGILRDMIAYTEADKSIFILSNLKKLEGTISPEDFKAANILERLQWFAEDPKVLNDNRRLFLQELKRLEDYKILTSFDDDIAEVQLKNKSSYIRSIKNILEYNDVSDIQNILNMYNKIAPFELAKSGATRAVKEAVKSFDRSVNLEIEEFFDKERDLQLGSAPTDILTILFSGSLIGYGLCRAKDKEERTSVILKSGIPIIGGVLTTMISAAKLMTNGKSLALGFVSGIALNQLGKLADIFYKKYQHK